MLNPKIKLSDLAYRKIMHWVNKSDYEVSGLGKLTFKDGIYYVHDVMLLPQKNGATHTDIEGEDVGKAMYLLKDQPGDLRFWWHSHVNMDVFWSGTDRSTIRDISQGGWFVATVFNKRREMRSAFYTINPFDIFVDQIATEVESLQDPRIADWDAEYDRNVTNVVPKWADLTPMGHGSGPTQSQTPKLSKRERKRLKRLSEQTTPTKFVPTELTDAYGLTAEDRATLAELGITDDDLDGFVEEGWTAAEIMQWAETQFYDDTPVADRRWLKN
jgi:hypothetical protein